LTGLLAENSSWGVWKKKTVVGGKYECIDKGEIESGRT
jgi:hypothetical protein